MKTKAIIEAVRDDLAANLPAIFNAEGVKGVDHFTIGSPANQEQTFCCVRLASLQGKKQIEFIIHLALPGVSELESYGCIQAVITYLDDEFDPTACGFDTSDYELRVLENIFTHGDIEILFSVMLNRELDDCS
ncbi:MAG: hypothetical protein LBH85_01605 [Treponema sp.]|jgi:hypothetical protein|nr:hypothetical protein [Treponema sp.]